MRWTWHGFFSEDLPFKNCKWLSLSQTYLRFFMIFTCQHTHSYCTQRFRGDHNRHSLGLKGFVNFACLYRDVWVRNQAVGIEGNVECLDSFDDECRLDGGKCVLNVNKDLLTNKIAKLAKHQPACQVPVSHGFNGFQMVNFLCYLKRDIRKRLPI